MADTMRRQWAVPVQSVPKTRIYQRPTRAQRRRGRAAANTDARPAAAPSAKPIPDAYNLPTTTPRDPRGHGYELLYLALAVFIAAAALVFHPQVSSAASSAANSVMSWLGFTAAAISTPRSAWTQGEVPYLYQIDPAWADEPYAGATVAESGCGPTCLSMVYVALTGKTDMGPATMAAFSESGGYVYDGMTAWALMTDGAATLGLSSWEVAADVSAVTAELAAGHPVICSVVPGDFTTTGHFIVLAGVADDGTLIVHDPNSAERSSKTWDAQQVIDQCAGLWAFK